METPKLPIPPLIPRAVPLPDWGKKFPMLAMEDAKLAPAIPMRATKIAKVP